MTVGKDQQLTKRDLMIAVWESLDCESIGASELEQIRQVVSERLGEGAAESPAAVARILADEGAVLRHPEVVECDAEWREVRLAGPAGKAGSKWSSLAEATESIAGFDRLRKELTEVGDHRGLRELSEWAIKIRQDRLMVAKSSILSDLPRAEAAELAAWLDVWLRTPDLFSDWLALRRASPGFLRRFGA